MDPLPGAQADVPALGVDMHSDRGYIKAEIAARAERVVAIGGPAD